MGLQAATCASKPILLSMVVLLVEDEPFVREVTSHVLESAGFEVLSAEDAVTAMKIFVESKRQIDLVMTDMVLPGRTGQQLGQDLQRRFPGVNVLVTSGYSNAEYATEEPASHMFFLAKPYSRRSLVEKIGKILGGLPSRRAGGTRPASGADVRRLHSL